ncbi:hypothetical protein GR160_15335 [Flavobacterium sp. Sd200]|uniref:hypothetical protein n=1 Tax=Flavobacterium sp. Sd200 TaxID=2692211 RepID=UPI00136F4B67|nr:hypothetical protein [Flavobacterium sp. Sd200]MXN92601.1 hypothetical protein [Flavobacterium sp. Sd200]
MEHKKISASQIERLYAFTQSHFVVYYDLQTELTDHLANAIEARWEHAPEISFEDALQAEFKKFGVYGFSDVVTERQEVLGKRYRKFLWHYIRQFFTLPKIILTGILTVATFKLIAYNNLIYMGMIAALMLITLFRIVSLKNSYENKVKNTGKRWLLEEIIYKCGNIGIFMGIPFQFFHFIVKEQTGNTVLWTMSAVLVVAFLSVYIVIFIMPAKAQEHLADIYPDYNLEKI